MVMPKKVAIIIPCFNNEENIPDLISELNFHLSLMINNVDLEINFIDDYSTDNTISCIKSQVSQLQFPYKIFVSNKNQGPYKNIAIFLQQLEADAYLVLAADMQDPPKIAGKMIHTWREKNCDVVFGRKFGIGDTLFSKVYHLFLSSFLVINAPKGGLDFVLFNQKSKYNIQLDKAYFVNPLLCLWRNAKTKFEIPYHKKSRVKGQSGWTLWKKINLLIETLVAFSSEISIALSILICLLFDIYLIIYMIDYSIFNSLSIYNHIFFLINLFLFILIFVKLKITKDRLMFKKTKLKLLS